MPTPLPALVKLEGAGAVPNSDDFRLGIGDMRRFLAGLLGVTGEVVDAVNALCLTKVSGDCLQTRVSAPAIAAAATPTTLSTRSTPPAFTPKKNPSLILVKCSVRYFQLDYANTGVNFGIYQDSTLISEAFAGIAGIAGYQNSTAILFAIISNTSLTARNFTLKSIADRNYPEYEADITRALWEISEYVA